MPCCRDIIKQLKNVKNFKKTAVAFVGSLFVSIASSHAVVLDFANLTNTDLSFLGNGTANGNGQFTLTSEGSGFQFDITSSGASDGLQGYITSSDLFTIGTITTSGSVQTAPVSGTATLYITDQNNVSLTATLQWQNIATFYGIVGGLDYTASVNLSDIQYTGNNSDLQALAAAGVADDVISFTSYESLSQLSDSPAQLSYSGSINSANVSPVPEPGTLSLMGIGALLVSFNRLRKRR